MEPALIRRSLILTQPREIAVREEELAGPGPGQVLVKTLFSGVSAGTELLVYRGLAPADMAVDAAIAALPGAFAFPLKYGYAAVGRVQNLGPGVPADWQGREVFAFNPHESAFLAAPEVLLPLPAGVAPEEAVFLANLETAVTLALDGRPLLGEQVAVFGQGIVGLLLTTVLARFPLAALVTLDLYPNRRLASESLGATASLDPADPRVMTRLKALLQGDRPYPGADLAYELTGEPEALNLALTALGFHGRVVVGSWYGQKQAPLNLGGHFHRQRQQIISSQVSTVEPSLNGRFSKGRILDFAWELLQDIRPARLITHRFPLEEAARAFELLDRQPEEALQVLLTY